MLPAALRSSPWLLLPTGCVIGQAAQEPGTSLHATLLPSRAYARPIPWYPRRRVVAPPVPTTHGSGSGPFILDPEVLTNPLYPV